MKMGMRATKDAFFHLTYFARKVEERTQDMAEELAAQAGRDMVEGSDVIAAYNKLFPNFWSKGEHDGSDRHKECESSHPGTEENQDDEGGVP